MSLTASEYFSYHISDSRNLVHATRLDFPAVTVCNMCPIRASALSKMAAASVQEQEVVEAASAEAKKKKRAVGMHINIIDNRSECITIVIIPLCCTALIFI